MTWTTAEQGNAFCFSENYTEVPGLMKKSLTILVAGYEHKLVSYELQGNMDDTLQTPSEIADFQKVVLCPELASQAEP